MTDQNSPRVGVVGAGLSGLGVAWRLAREGVPVTVLEKDRRTGGVILSEREDGFLCEAGPNSMLLKSRTAEDFLGELGLDERILRANPDAERRFLVKNGKVVPLPASLRGGVTTPLYSFGAKLRLLAEPFVRPAPPDADESVASFVTRRMGHEFLDYGITALVSGIYAGDPEKLSIRHAFPKVYNLEAKYGSLIGGAIKLRKERKRTGETPYKSRLIAFPDGIETLTRTLADTSAAEIRTGAEVHAIARDGAAWRVAWREGDEERSDRFGELVVSVPAFVLPRLPWPEEMRGAMAALRVPHHPPVTTLVLGYRRKDVAHPLDGFGMLIPLVEERKVLGAIFSSSSFPGRAPEGHVSLMVFIGGATMPEKSGLSDEETVALAHGQLEDLLGLRAPPVFHKANHWPLAIPQYNVGHGEFIGQLEDMERRWPGLSFCANYRGGPGLSDCLDSTIRTARDVGQRLRP